MAVEKLKNVKLINSVRLNNIENFFYNSDKADITLDGVVLRLHDKHSKDTRYTPIMNVICFDKLEDCEPKEDSKGKK